MNLTDQIEYLPELLEFESDRNNNFWEHSFESDDHDAEVRVKIIGSFDALETFKRVHDLMPPIGYCNRVTLDFSDASSFDPFELSHFLIETSWHPRFAEIEFSVENLQPQCVNKRENGG